MAIKSFSKQSLGVNLHNLTKSLELVTAAIVINVVIGGFSGEDLK